MNMTWEDWGAISQIVLTLFTIASVFIAYRTYKDGKQRKKVEISVNLAHYYQENIIQKISYIIAVLEGTPAEDLMKRSFPRKSVKDFDQEELISLSGKPNITYLVDKTIDEIPIQNILFSKAVYMDRLKQMSKQDILLSIGDLQKSGKASATSMLAEFKADINELLNILEWFSMNFVQEIADEESVYQSLHQSFISIVYSLYYFISKNNTQNCGKYFTNLIALYNIWSERKQNLARKEEKFKRKVKNKVSKASRNHRNL